MHVEAVKIKLISFRILPEFYRTGIPSEYCVNNDQVTNVIQHNKQYRIILVCRVEDIQQLYETIISRFIHKVYVFGNCTKLNIEKNEVTVVNTNERDLMLDIIRSVINYIHDEEIQQRKLENHRIADERAMDILQLLDQLETLYFNRQ